MPCTSYRHWCSHQEQRGFSKGNMGDESDIPMNSWIISEGQRLDKMWYSQLALQGCHQVSDFLFCRVLFVNAAVEWSITLDIFKHLDVDQFNGQTKNNWHINRIKLTL